LKHTVLLTSRPGELAVLSANRPHLHTYDVQEAPLDVQEKANCIVGKDYPAPIVDHKEIHKVNIGRIKKAYAEQEGKQTEATTSVMDSPAKKQKR
jgi:cryptochrome